MTNRLISNKAINYVNDSDWINYIAADIQFLLNYQVKHHIHVCITSYYGKELYVGRLLLCVIRWNSFDSSGVEITDCAITLIDY